LLTFVSEAEAKEIRTYFSERFGIRQEFFNGFRLLKKGMIWIVSDAPPLNEMLRGLKVETAGLPFLRIRRPWKPTTVGLQLIGPYATRNVIELDEVGLEGFLSGEPMIQPFPADPGFVIVKWNGEVLGCGLYGKGGLRSQIPGETLRQLKLRFVEEE
jgi:NOL1/NOP2/fmu family ribosome biogenesis protein